MPALLTKVGSVKAGGALMSAERVQASRARAIQTGEVDVLYLFARAIEWRRDSDDAGWELMGALASSERGTRTLAEAFLEAIG